MPLKSRLLSKIRWTAVACTYKYFASCCLASKSLKNFKFVGSSVPRNLAIETLSFNFVFAVISSFRKGLYLSSGVIFANLRLATYVAYASLRKISGDFAARIGVDFSVTILPISGGVGLL